MVEEEGEGLFGASSDGSFGGVTLGVASEDGEIVDEFGENQFRMSLFAVLQLVFA